MTQRLTIATLLLVFVVTMGMCLATWRSMASLPARNAQLEQANAELLEELRSLMTSRADTDYSGPPSERSHLQVRCVLDTPDGPPAEQVRVQLESDEETGILNLARFTGRLTITPHEPQGSESPRIADSPFRELNQRARALGLPDETKLIAVPALSEAVDDETPESTSAKEPTVGAYVKLAGKVPLGHSYNTIVTIPQGPRSWAEKETDPLLMQGIAHTPKEFRPRYQVYLLQAGNQEQEMQLTGRMHEVRVEQVAAGPASLW